MTHLDTRPLPRRGRLPRTTASDDCTVPSLGVGTYQVKIEYEDFKAHVSIKVVLNARATVRVDTVLEPGANDANVEVVANALLLQRGRGED